MVASHLSGRVAPSAFNRARSVRGGLDGVIPFYGGNPVLLPHSFTS